MRWLNAKGTKIVADNGKETYLRGVNLGGWLMMEAYFMHAPNFAEQLMKAEFRKTLGDKALKSLESSFRNNFIQPSDFKTVKSLGCNSIRLPFNCRLIETKPYVYDPKGLAYLKTAVRWAKDNGLYVILDLHAAPGAQNHDWHSDSLGKAQLWTSKANQRRALALWEHVADAFKDESAVAGYDLLNEAVTEDAVGLNRFYEQLIKTIRRVDRRHMFFIEGNRWAQDIQMLHDFNDDNWVYSIHFYEPLEYTFNFVPHLQYPLRSKNGVWDKNTMRRRLKGYQEMSRQKQRPMHVGEFGVNYRRGIDGEDVYLKDVLTCFKDFGWHWHYWTYKAIKHFMFPDGIYSYYPNPLWVHRPGPRYGWQRWSELWPKHRNDMIASWQTKNFSLNTGVSKTLRAYA